MNGQARHEADLSYVLKSLEDFAFYGKHSFPAKEPVLLKVFYPHVAAEYFGIKYIDDPHVKMSKAAAPESAKCVEICLKIAEKGLQPVQVFRAKSTSYYEWDPKAKSVTPVAVKPTFEEWLSGIKVEIPTGLRVTYPHVCANGIARSKQYPHPPEQLNIVLELIAALYAGLKDHHELKLEAKYLVTAAYQIVVECQMNDMPDYKTPEATYKACVEAHDKMRDFYMESMEKAFRNIKSLHLQEVLKHIGFIIWDLYDFRDAALPDVPKKVTSPARCKVYCKMIEKIIPV